MSACLDCGFGIADFGFWMSDIGCETVGFEFGDANIGFGDLWITILKSLVPQCSRSARGRAHRRTALEPEADDRMSVFEIPGTADLPIRERTYAPKEGRTHRGREFRFRIPQVMVGPLHSVNCPRPQISVGGLRPPNYTFPRASLKLPTKAPSARARSMALSNTLGLPGKFASSTGVLCQSMTAQPPTRFAASKTD